MLSRTPSSVRVTKHCFTPDTERLLRRYLERVRCPGGLPAIGSDQEREKLLVGSDVTRKGSPY